MDTAAQRLPCGGGREERMTPEQRCEAEQKAAGLTFQLWAAVWMLLSALVFFGINLYARSGMLDLRLGDLIVAFIIGALLTALVFGAAYLCWAWVG
jgi:hypothetical protein